MQHRAFRSLLVLALLTGGLLFVVLSGQFGFDIGKIGAQEYRYLADLDYWQATSRERLVTALAAFDLGHDLNDVPLRVGDWSGEDIPQTNIGVYIVLEPEQYVERLYRNSEGRFLWLTMIGGRGSRTFHPPESCYDSYGWQTQLTSHTVTLEDGSLIYGMLVDAVKETTEQLSFYFYLFPNSRRNPADGIVIFRVTSPRYGTIDETMAMQDEFVRHFFSDAKADGHL